MSGRSIEDLIAQSHTKDVVVTECKDGPTWNGPHRRLDVWVLKRSWSPVTMIGYEIKRTRSDFLRDKKWPAYRDLCHELYFVCPNGVIQPDELPPDVGLKWVAKTGTRLYTKKRAQSREIDVPVDLLLYVLISRTKITANDYHPRDGERGVEYWRDWLATKIEKQRIGYEVTGRIRKIVQRVERENDNLKYRMKSYDKVLERLSELGLNPNECVSKWEIEDKLQKLGSTIDPRLQSRIESAARDLYRAAELVDELNQAAGGSE